MKISLLKKKPNGSVLLQVEDTTAPFLNYLRRLLINDIPSMAIDTVEIHENSSAMYDEMLAHRIGLLVIKTDLDACFLKDSHRYNVQLSLNTTGPCTVYAEMFKSKDPAIIPVHGKTPLTILQEGQSLKLIATATTGRGREHCKYSPGLMHYRNLPILKDKEEKKISNLIKSFSADEQFHGKKIKDIPVHELSMACLSALEDEGLVEQKQTSFLVTIEPWGQLSAAEILDSLGRVAEQQWDELSDSLKKAK